MTMISWRYQALFLIQAKLKALGGDGDQFSSSWKNIGKSLENVM